MWLGIAMAWLLQMAAHVEVLPWLDFVQATEMQTLEVEYQVLELHRFEVE
jgi:hypothetical protein